MTHSPSTELYSLFQRLFVEINALFDPPLPVPMFALDQSPKTFGYYRRGRFVSAKGEIADEIAINPRFFATHGFRELVQTMAHEMVHQWQAHHGKSSRSGYHNAEWGGKMESIGLMPSSTGKPGGKKTGQCVADYLIEGGSLEALYQRLNAEGVMIPWYDRLVVALAAEAGVGFALSSTVTAAAVSLPVVKPEAKAKTCYSHQCSEDTEPLKVWGRKGLALTCGLCGGVFAEGRAS